jgi:hypothetical protein
MYVGPPPVIGPPRETSIGYYQIKCGVSYDDALFLLFFNCF